eukprot:scaffold12548_cov128-Isochrysis_galbana.AAC.4
MLQRGGAGVRTFPKGAEQDTRLALGDTHPSHRAAGARRRRKVNQDVAHETGRVQPAGDGDAAVAIGHAHALVALADGLQAALAPGPFRRRHADSRKLRRRRRMCRRSGRHVCVCAGCALASRSFFEARHELVLLARGAQATLAQHCLELGHLEVRHPSSSRSPYKGKWTGSVPSSKEL